MFNWNRCAKINVKVLIILIIVMVALGSSLFAARQVRRSLISKMEIESGEAAFENKDWSAASKHFQEYLGRNPDDVEILKKYAKAQLSIRPLEGPNIMQAIAAYRRVVQLQPLDEEVYVQLSKIYSAVGSFEDLAYVARARLEHFPDDHKAPLWLADALIKLNKLDQAQQTLEKLIKDIGALPGKYDEYVRACVGISQILITGNSSEAEREALEWLNKAVDYMPGSAQTLANRARFYRETPEVSNLSENDRLIAARKDLEAADVLGTKDFKILYLLGTEWMAHGELDKAEAKLQAIDNLTQEDIEKYFLDIKDWKLARFIFALELAIQRGDSTKAASLTDEAMKLFTEERHRLQMLPSIIPVYVTTDKVNEARKCLNEYLDLEAIHIRQVSTELRSRRIYLQALVASAEQKYYDVINILQPIIEQGSSNPVLLRFLAQAYSQTGQARRAIGALTEYLSDQSQDFEMTRQLAREYSKLKDWKRAFETAKLAESLDPKDVTSRVLRIAAAINLETEQDQGLNKAKLEELAVELAQMREQYPDMVDIRSLQASIADYLGDTGSAEKELKLAIEDNQETLIAQMQLVSHYYQSGRIDEAIKVCQGICELYGGVARPWLSLSELHVSNGDYEAAFDCLEQGIKTVTERSENRSLLLKLAVTKIAYGDRDAGTSLLEELAEDEQEVRARVLLLSLEEMRGDIKKANEILQDLQKIEGESGVWWRLYQASLLLSSDDWRSKQRDITDLLQYCINADPHWSAPVLLLVGMYEKLEDFRSVEDICKKALAQNPSATDIADRLLRLLEKQGRFSEAEQFIQQIQADARVTSAWQVRAALSEGDISRAIEELKLRALNDEQDAESRIQLARLIYQQTKDADQAFMYLKDAEEINENSQTLVAVKVSILRAEGRSEEAKQILNNYVGVQKDFTSHLMRAVYLAEEGEFDDAEGDYKKLISFTEQGASGYELLSNFYVSSEKLDKAVTTLEEGILAYPENSELKRRLMQLLFLPGQTENRERALGILAELEERMPQDTDLMRIRAVELLRKPSEQSLREAKEKLEDVIKLKPTEVNAHMTLIKIAMQEGQYEIARDYAIRGLGSNPDNPALLSARGAVELILGNSQMAVKLARMVIESDPNNTEAINVLSDAARSSGDTDLLEETRKLVKSTVDSDPADEQRLLWGANMLTALERPEMAIPVLEAYCKTTAGAKSINAIVTLAHLYRLTGDMERAKQQIEHAELVDPSVQAVIHARFLWLAAQNRLDEIEEISSKYISAKEQNPAMLIEAGLILSASDSIQLKKEGLVLFEHAVELSPTLLNANLYLASALYNTGNIERAKNKYRDLLEQYPENIQIINDLAWILQEHDYNYEAALELAERGLSLAPNSLHLLDTRGTILLNIPDRLLDAKTDFEKLIELSTLDNKQKARAFLKLGRICVKLNDLIQARGYLERALEINRKIEVFTDEELLEIRRIVQGDVAKG